MKGCCLVQKNGYIGGRRLTGKSLQGRKSHHNGCHFVLIYQNDLLGKLLIIADAAVATEKIVEKFCYVINDQILL